MNVWLLASSHSCHTRKFTFPAAPPRKTCHANHLSPDHWSTNKHRRISAAQQQSSRTQSAETSRERLSQRLLLRTHRAFYRLQKDRINQRDIDSSWRASPARRLKLVTGLSLQLIVCVCARLCGDREVHQQELQSVPVTCSAQAQTVSHCCSQMFLLQTEELGVLWFMVMWLKLITEHQRTRWLKDTVELVLAGMLLVFLF